MENHKKVYFGSGDSVDTDVVYFFDKLPELSECKRFCSEDENENRNIAVVKNGVVVECYKGSPDETNNAVYKTYCLHKQDFENPVKRELPRDVYLKCVRSLRVVLSHLSRSEYRSKIKSSLRGGWFERVNALMDVDFAKVDFETCNGKMSKEDTLKVVAFQMAQTFALYNGMEFYTKTELANEYKTLLPFLYRKPDEYDINSLNNFKFFYTGMLLELDGKDVEDGVVLFHGYKKINLITEKNV